MILMKVNVTILEALAWGGKKINTTLDEKKNPGHRPKLDAQVLLAYALNRPTSYLIGHLTDELTASVQEKYLRLIERRTRHEPVAYLTGEKSFYGRSFFVNQNVLVPRPDTETLVDEVLKRISLNALLIDVGTGSGAIGVSVAAQANHPIVATDTSINALQVAKINAQQHGVEHLVSLEHAPLLGTMATQSYATAPSLVIAANLPYLPISYRELIDPDVINYEPHEALFAGIDGLDAYDALLSQIKNRRAELPKRIELLMEIDPSQTSSLPRLVHSIFPEAQIEIINDLSRRPRVVIATF
jgi:release factor glutamine methyltransferase